jgi:hypothetical protein
VHVENVSESYGNDLRLLRAVRYMGTVLPVPAASLSSTLAAH